MRKIVVLSRKSIKVIFNLLDRQWGSKPDFDGLVFVETKDGRFSIINRDFIDLPLDKLRINSLGLYFGQVRNDSLRLSIEGSQFVGPFASKNVLELDDDQWRSWLLGEDLEISYPDSFVLIKHNNDFFGSGRIKDSRLFNFVPKPRRVNFI